MPSHGVNGSTSLLPTPHIKGSQSPPQGFETSFIKFATSYPIAFRTPIWTWMVFILEPTRKWLGVDPHVRMHFGTLGTSFIKFSTSFIKFGTFDPIASKTHIQTWMVHNFILEPIWKCLEVDPHLRTHFKPLVHHSQNLVHPMLSLLGSPSEHGWSIISFRNP